jgi:hypothetical protein
MKIKTAILLAILFAVVAADFQRYSTASYRTGGNPTCSSCYLEASHKLPTFRSGHIAAVSIAGIQAGDVVQATLNAELASCNNPSKWKLFFAVADATSLPSGMNGCDPRCPSEGIDNEDIQYTTVDSTCKSAGVDVTQKLKDAINAGRTQLLFSFDVGMQDSDCAFFSDVGIQCTATVDHERLFLTVKSNVTEAPTTAPPTCSQGLFYNNKDIEVYSVPGGKVCGHSAAYNLNGSSSWPLYTSFDISNIPATSEKVEFYIQSNKCANTDRLYLTASTVDPNAKITSLDYGTNSQCPSYTALHETRLQVNENCLSTAIDVTSALRAAKQVGNNELVISLFSASEDGTGFCGRFENPNVEPHYDDTTNCGIQIASDTLYTYHRSCFLAVTTCNEQATTNAPTTQKPSTTGVPTTLAPCWTCPAGYVHWYDVEGMTQPDDVCACVNAEQVTTKAPVPTVNLSGDNNARVSSSATRAVSIGMFSVALIVTMFM